MTKLVLSLILLFTTNAFSQALECRAVNNTKIGIYVDLYDNQVIDQSKNIFKKIGSDDGIDIFRGYDIKHGKYFVWMIKYSGNYNNISTFDSVIMEDTDNSNKTPLICFDANEVREYRKNNKEGK